MIFRIINFKAMLSTIYLTIKAADFAGGLLL